MVSNNAIGTVRDSRSSRHFNADTPRSSSDAIKGVVQPGVKQLLLRKKSLRAAEFLVLVQASGQRGACKSVNSIHGVRAMVRHSRSDAAIRATHERGVDTSVRAIRAGGVQGSSPDFARAVRADVRGAPTVRAATDEWAELRAAPARRTLAVARG